MAMEEQPHWFSVLGDMAIWRMRDSLLTLDEEERVNPYDPEVKRIQIGVEKIIKEMVRSVSREDSRFGGRIIEMGSYYSQTMIGKPDAFDYGLELRLSDLVAEPAEDQEIEWLWKQRGFMTDLKKTFEKLMNSVFEKTAMPSNWRHGGFNEPRYSGFRRNGPACIIQFTYRDPVSDRKTHLLAQLFLVVKVPFSSICNHQLPIFTDSEARLTLSYKMYKYSLLEYFQQHRTEFIHLPIWPDLPPTYIEMVLYAMSIVEQKWINQYSAQSVAKRAIRICKSLVSRFLPVQSKHVRSSLKRSTRKTLDGVYIKMEKCRTFQNGVIGFKRLGDPANFEKGARLPLLSYTDVELAVHNVRRYNLQKPGGHSFNDVNEQVQKPQLFSSHLFRHIILTMMASEKKHGREWTMDDLPQLIVHIFDIINDHLEDIAVIEPGPSCLEFKNQCFSTVVRVLLQNDLFSASTYRRQMLVLSEVLREMAHDNSPGVMLYKVVRHGHSCSPLWRTYKQTLGIIYAVCLFWVGLALACRHVRKSPKMITAKVKESK